MPLYDFDCDRCGNKVEAFLKMDTEKNVVCDKCGEPMRYVPNIGMIQGEEAEWINDVTAVVDREGGDACQKFIDSPTRTNYKNWMKSEGLRPLEPGEERVKRRSKGEREAERHKLRCEAAKGLQKARSLSMPISTK